VHGNLHLTKFQRRCGPSCRREQTRCQCRRARRPAQAKPRRSAFLPL